MTALGGPAGGPRSSRLHPEPRRPSKTLRLLPPRTPSALCTGASGSGPGRPVFLRGGEGLGTQVTSLGKRRERPEDEAWMVRPQATSPARELCPGGGDRGSSPRLQVKTPGHHSCIWQSTPQTHRRMFKGQDWPR
uniref:Uncharacterized protein n=1 Tax=Rousettus aegyptiacus TaxID=9407 RepID=A0A7J8BAB5_ROUAE|nr:hypothetical protein HJG63_009953 [Rousettus aegyptiacus]